MERSTPMPGVILRTWPYGTRRAVEIRHTERVDDYVLLACTDLENPSEGFVILTSMPSVVALFHTPAVGQKRLIEFTPGGRAGRWVMLDGLDISPERREAGRGYSR